MNILDYITIILFSIGVLITGVSFSKTGKDMKSFFSGGGNVPWGMSGLFQNNRNNNRNNKRKY